MTKQTVSKHWRKPVGLSDKAWIPPAPLHHVTIIQLQATASMHGVRVPMWQTQSAGPVRTAHMSVHEMYCTSAISSVRLESVSVETSTMDIDTGVNAFVMTRIVRITATAHHCITSQSTPASNTVCVNKVAPLPNLIFSVPFNYASTNNSRQTFSGCPPGRSSVFR